MTRDYRSDFRSAGDMKIDSVFLGRLLIWSGVAVWLVYIIGWRVFGLNLDVGPFLLAHVLGIVPGVIIRGGLVRKIVRRVNQTHLVHPALKGGVCRACVTLKIGAYKNAEKQGDIGAHPRPKGRGFRADF